MIQFRVGTMALAALYCCMAREAAAAPNVAYAASGTFAATPISGLDLLNIQGQQFSVSILANEALKPTRHDKTSARYDNLSMQGVVYSGLSPGRPFALSNNTTSMTLRVGAAGEPDECDIRFPVPLGIPVTVTAHASMPAGTIHSWAILPFSAPVTLSLANATVTYADSSSFTTLALAGGALSAAVETPPPNLKVVHSFAGPDGQLPNGLVSGQGGGFYGTTDQGGDGNLGTVFALTPPAAPGTGWDETVLHTFPSGGGDGVIPTGGPVLRNDGALFGSTLEGGTQSLGIVFKLAPPAVAGGAWTESVLHNFGAAGDGGYPSIPSIGRGGVLYGTTSRGGTYYGGTVFALTPPTKPGAGWTETLLHSFDPETFDGFYPLAGVLIGNGGVLYGTTSAGGSFGQGIVFQLTPGPTWTETVLNSFTGLDGDGASPSGPLTLGADGVLYGTTEFGGTFGLGTVFRLTPGPGVAWTESVLYSFQGPAFGDGANPTAGVLMGGDGALYGVTSSGGIGGFGTVFKLTPPSAGSNGQWTEMILTTFDSSAGFGPLSSLVWGAGGHQFGTLGSGGAFNDGAVFECRPN